MKHLNLSLLFLCFCFQSYIISAQAPECEIKKNNTLYYLNSLRCFKEFNYLQGAPLTSKYSQVKCVKIVYWLKDKQVYYTNSKIFRFHYDFCTSQLGYLQTLEYFNYDQYGDNDRREFLLANLNYYAAENKYVFEFFADDKVSTERIIQFYEHLKATSYFGGKLFLMINSEEMMSKASLLKGKVPLIYPEEVYAFEKYQALNKEEAYGFVHKINDYNKEKHTIKEQDILIIKNIPQDIPLIAGILTDQFQTPLSHINVLSHNRKTPNAASKGIWSNPSVDSLEGKLVHYVVKDDAFILKAATIKEAEKFWMQKNKSTATIVLKLNSATSGLLNIKDLSIKSVSLVGGKAANMGELSKIMVNNKPLPIPEAAFAIPFYYYLGHIHKNNIMDSIQQVINSDSIKNNYTLLDARLKKIRAMIKQTPIDTALIRMVEEKIGKTRYSAFRFRSSTNSEDIDNFNGAGLYDSKTGILGDSLKTIEKAIKQVWASLWNTRAFQERQNFKIDQQSVAMAILVHKAFGEESANGVAITSHIYRDDYPAYTINVQKGEASVVFPPDSISCDQIIIGTRHITGNGRPSIEYITRSNVKPDGNVLTQNEIGTLKDYLSAIKLHYYKKIPMILQNSYDNFSMDVEFKLDAVTRKIVIKQARSY